jgi:hypothetical protein
MKNKQTVIKHVKLRNTGILFELLVRKIAADVLDGKPDSFAVKIMREHFTSKSELGKELQLYRSFFSIPKLSEGKSFDMLDVILKKRRTLNEKMLAAQKFLLIKEIKEQCDIKQFMAGRVPSYKVYASIYKLFESQNSSDNISNIEDILSSRFVVVEHLQGNLKEEPIIKENGYTELLKQQPKEIRYLSYKILLEKFNETYSVFTDKQKQLLREYINNGTNVDKFSKFLSEEAGLLSKRIATFIPKVTHDVTKIKLNEVLSQLNNIKQKPSIKENYITALLIAYQISHELETLS